MTLVLAQIFCAHTLLCDVSVVVANLLRYVCVSVTVASFCFAFVFAHFVIEPAVI